MATYVTLEFNDLEKSLADWGFALSGARAEFVNQAADSLALVRAGANIADEPIFGFEDKVILRVNRKSSTGKPNSFSEGLVDFIGYRMETVLDARPEWEGVHYHFANAWYFLESTTFQQPRASRPTGVPDVEYPLTSDVCLFMKKGESNEFVKLTNGQQIQIILQFLLDYPPTTDATPYTIGTIDPAVDIPTFRVREVTCAAALSKCLDVSPDCTVWFDYNAAGVEEPVPRIHVRKRSNLTPVTLQIANGVDHRSLQITPRHALLPASVLIYYRITGTNNGTQWVAFDRDKFGPNGANSTSDPDAGPGVILQTIDLQGSDFEKASLDTTLCLANATNQQVRKEWWQQYHSEFAHDETTVTSISDATIVDGEGAAVSLDDYPYVVRDGAILSWMTVNGDPVVGVNVTISAEAAYKTSHKASESGATVQTKDVISNFIQTRVTLTNGNPGVYSKMDEGEGVPEGIAREVYEALATLQYEGEHILVEDMVTHQIGMGNTLNLSGGRSEWATMKAQIQRVSKDYGRGETSISIGPAKHLSAGDLAAIQLFNRARRAEENPMVRITAGL